MENISNGQVVLVAFPFSDLSSKKVRPCLVVGLAEFGDIVVCQITSQAYASKKALSLTKADFRGGCLAINSFIRPDKIATLDQDMVTKTIGTLKPAKRQQVKAELKTLLQI